MFGTIAQVEILDPDAERAGRALDAIEALYRELDRDWRSFGDGELGRVNAALLAGKPAPLSARLEELVRRALEFQALSDGLFEPRLGQLGALWGFQDMAHRARRVPPEYVAIAALRERSIGQAVLHLHDHSISSAAPVSLDLNALAEGAALRAGAALLADLGVRSALIDTGGDVLVLGRRGDRPWRIGIRRPGTTDVLGNVALQPGEAIASSGSYEHRYGPDGQYHHILDPRTGRPSRGSIGATVISADPERADAAATVLVVAEPGRFEEMTRRMQVEYALVVDQHGAVRATAAMRRRLGWDD
ncbi:MAG: FAD:protein FMN transferase [Gammaproteobacteria bacterium]|nr:FAD:protein FMN transferase [Gammaproteobacteria bacterium]